MTETNLLSWVYSGGIYTLNYNAEFLTLPIYTYINHIFYYFAMV